MLRRIPPYYHEYKANAKLRWYGRTCLDVFSSEFRNHTSDYYRDLITSGKMKILRNPISRLHRQLIEGDDVLSTLLMHDDQIIHWEHVHEPPVPEGTPSIIHEDDKYLVVNKPPGVPVHPTSRYYRNSVLQMLYEEKPSWAPLYPVHRLDKLTSGVLIFGKSAPATNEFKHSLRDHTVRKRYLATVKGLFPDQARCDDPIVYIYGAIGTVKQFGPALTEFTRLQYDHSTDSSLVECHPHSGYPHQIRIHLRNLLHPIIDDGLYADKYTERFTSKEQVTSQYLEQIYERSMADRRKMEAGKCPECHQVLYRDPDNLSIRLHASRYQVGGTVWEASDPEWKLQWRNIEQS